MKDWKKAEDAAATRFQLVSPLLAEGLDAAKIRQLKEQICAQTGLSERTLRRYLAQYRAEGFSGLKPKAKKALQREEADASLIEQAILLRREVPGRSIAQIIQILEWEGKAAPGQLKRSTLQEQLAARGYSSRQMRMYADTGVAARRVQKRHRNQLWQSDVKYGPYLPIGPKGVKKQVYLVLMLDDATRYVLHGEFYPTLDQSIVENCFRQAIQKYGKPKAVYFDNGAQYRTKWMGRTCSKLGIRLLYTKPYAPESKGKIERLNRVVDGFLNEITLENPRTLEQLNERFQIWLTECYHSKPHSALRENITPEAAYRGDRKALDFVDADILAQAFLHAEKRKVDKSGSISFMDKKYEVGVSFMGCTVDVVYDPADIRELTIEYEGHAPWKAHPLVIGERAGQRPPLPAHLQAQPANASRLLDAAEQQYQQRKEKQLPAVSYRAVWKEENGDV